VGLLGLQFSLQQAQQVQRAVPLLAEDHGEVYVTFDQECPQREAACLKNYGFRLPQIRHHVSDGFLYVFDYDRARMDSLSVRPDVHHNLM